MDVFMSACWWMYMFPLLSMYMFKQAYVIVHFNIRGQLLGFYSVLPLCRFLHSYSYNESGCQVSLPAEIHLNPYIVFHLENVNKTGTFLPRNTTYQYTYNFHSIENSMLIENSKMKGYTQ